MVASLAVYSCGVSKLEVDGGAGCGMFDARASLRIERRN